MSGSAYKVGVTVEVTGNSTAFFDKLIGDVERFNKVISEAQRALAKFSRADVNVDKLSKALASLDKQGVGQKITADLESMVRVTDSATAAADKLMRVLRENAELAGSTARAVSAAGRAGGPSGPGGPPRGAAGHGGRFTGHDLMHVGLGASLVGAPMVEESKSAFQRAAEIEHMRQQMLADQRVSGAQADAAVAAAFEATKTAPGSKVSTNLESLIDLKNIFGSLDEATKMLPAFAQMSTMLQLVDKKQGGAGDSAFAAAKALEIMGGMISETTDASGHTVRELNPEQLTKKLAMMQRVTVAENGRVDPATYLGFAKQARVAGMSLDDEFTFEQLPSWLATTGGPRVGTALMSMAQVFRGDKLTDKSYDAMAKIGLADRHSASHVERDPKTGRMRNIGHDADGIYDLQLMQTKPLAYMAAAQARMEAAGIHGTEAQITALLKASQRSTIAGALAELLKDAPSILKGQQNIKSTSLDAFNQFAQNDPMAKLQQMQAAFDKLLVVLGGAVMGDAIAGMGHVTDALNAMADWAKRHPDMARILQDTAAGLGALAIALGALSTALFLFGPLIKLFGPGPTTAKAAAAGLPAISSVVGGAVVAGGGIVADTVQAQFSGRSVIDEWLDRNLLPLLPSWGRNFGKPTDPQKVSLDAGSVNALQQALSTGMTAREIHESMMPHTGPQAPTVRLTPAMPGGSVGPTQ